MKWASVASEKFALRDAVEECAAYIRSELGDGAPDLAVAFISAHHSPDYEELPRLLREQLGAKLLLGCSAGGVIGGGREVEERAGLTVTAALLPGVELVPFYVEDGALPDPDARSSAWEELVHVPATKAPDFVLLPDPHSIRAENLLAGLDYAFPGSAKIGGLASGGDRAGSNALYLGDTVHWSGAVGVAISGNLRVDTIVAQGCRPIGELLVVTRCHQNVLLEVDHQRPMEVLRRIFEASDERDRALITRALHLGVVNDPLKEELHQGDFLIRNVLGVDGESGGLVVGEVLREGQSVQFQVRDARTAAEDLQAMLRRYVSEHGAAQSSGALLFSCLGRGMHFFGQPDHDTDLFRSEVGPIPLGGFFCNGEIGAVGPTTYLHGYTSSFGLFSPR